jgi:signal transduction histidine kinase
MLNLRMQDLVLPILAVGIVALVCMRRDRAATSPRGRRRELVWCAALLVITVSLMSTVYSLLIWNRRSPWWVLLIPAAAVIILIVRPRWAAVIVPVALVLYGLFGFMVARNYASYGVHTYGLTMVGNAGFEADVILPQAYLFLLLGLWLLWRAANPWRSRLLYGRLADLNPRGQLSAMLLVPVAIAASAFLTPSLWLGTGAGLIWTAAVLGGAVTVVRKQPELAARVATVGVVCLGLAGLAVAAWGGGGGFGIARTPLGYILYGAVLVTTQHTADAAGVQGLGLLVLGAWLAPQSFPQVRRLLGMASDAELLSKVQRLTESRAVAVDTAAADLRRLERDLHDGAQARLVALGMSLRAAERLILTSPEAAIALVAEARETSARALTELRELVRGVLPPVLADRGLADAVRALALDCPLAVETDVDLPGRLPAPVETACYFAVAEVLTNAAKHSGARDARLSMSHASGLLRIEVTDFGLGGADPARGSGLAGVEKRLATFDGILVVSSPIGGPTMVVMEVPCALSSPRISSS